MKVVDAHPLGDTELGHVDAWWRAADYLAVGQIYLLAAVPPRARRWEACASP